MRSYKYDLHIHTRDSSMCGGAYAADIVRLYRKAGYDGIAITDHYFDYGFYPMKADSWGEKIDKLLLGYENAKKAAHGTGFSVILGMELRFESSLDDYLVYGFDEEFLHGHKELYKLGLCGFYELIKDKDILVFRAHPFRLHDEPISPRYLDGVEAYNGKDTGQANARAESFAREHGLIMISGSDMHNPHESAQGGVVLPERVADQKDLVRLLKSDIMGLVKGGRTVWHDAPGFV